MGPPCCLLALLSAAPLFGFARRSVRQDQATDVEILIVRHQLKVIRRRADRRRQTMFTKQVSRPMDKSRSPIEAAEAQQVEQLEERPGHGPDPRLCPTGPNSPYTVSPQRGEIEERKRRSLALGARRGSICQQR
jgi:hypothetical protein